MDTPETKLKEGRKLFALGEAAALMGVAICELGMALGDETIVGGPELRELLPPLVIGLAAFIQGANERLHELADALGPEVAEVAQLEELFREN